MGKTFKYSIGKTINLGNYNSLRLEVGIEIDDAENDNVARSVNQIEAYLERKIEQHIRKFKTKADYLERDE